MFADPQSITIDGTNHSLACIKRGQENAEYRNAGRTVRLQVSHQSRKTRTRSMYRVDVDKIAADPITTDNVSLSCGIYLVIDKPAFGFTEADVINQLTGIVNALSASTYAAAKKLNAGES